MKFILSVVTYMISIPLCMFILAMSYYVYTEAELDKAKIVSINRIIGES